MALLPTNHGSLPLVLLILDGFGYKNDVFGNAVAQAPMPMLKSLMGSYPWSTLHASGPAVGLLPGFMGNSEVGHLTIGAGRVIPSPLVRFSELTSAPQFNENEIVNTICAQLKKSGKRLHFIGLLSDAGVHSYQDQLHALMRACAANGINNQIVHAITDGRDTLPQSAATYFTRLEAVFGELGCGKLGSLVGRFYAMDRDQNLDRTEVAVNALRDTTSPISSWREALEVSYAQGLSDEFLLATRCAESAAIQPGDAVIFFNFRPDRMRQLVDQLLNPAHPKSYRGCSALSFAASAVDYWTPRPAWAPRPFLPHLEVTDTLFDALAAQLPAGNNHLATLAETEKKTHVQYFLRGERNITFPHETQIIVPSLKERSYVQHPEMSAADVTQQALKQLDDPQLGFMAINYANADMVGHSGNFDATMAACAVLDEQIKILYDKVMARGGSLVITADHGNAEEKLDSITHQQLTAHSQNPVIFMICHPSLAGQASSIFAQGRGLATVAPTILHFCRLKAPVSMDPSLFD